MKLKIVQFCEGFELCREIPIAKYVKRNDKKFDLTRVLSSQRSSNRGLTAAIKQLMIQDRCNCQLLKIELP